MGIYILVGGLLLGTWWCMRKFFGLSKHSEVENVKALLEVEVENVKTLLEVERQQLLYNGREVRNSEMLSALGVRDEDFIMFVSNASSRYT
ncbi:hypothetical protein PS1_047704 [Malus domestica]